MMRTVRGEDLLTLSSQSLGRHPFPRLDLPWGQGHGAAVFGLFFFLYAEGRQAKMVFFCYFSWVNMWLQALRWPG